MRLCKELLHLVIGGLCYWKGALVDRNDSTNVMAQKLCFYGAAGNPHRDGLLRSVHCGRLPLA